MRKKSKKALAFARQQAKRNTRVDEPAGGPSSDDESSWMEDEVDQHHKSRSKIDTSILNGEDTSDSEEEVYRMRSSSSEEEEEEEEDVQFEDEEDGDSSEEMEEEKKIIDSDIEDSEEDYLPDADAWGKKRSAFYNVDYTGDDHIGFHSSDEEPADLEEKEAIDLQKSLNEWVSGVHDQFPSLKIWEQENKMVPDTAAESGQEGLFHVPIDLSSLSQEQKAQILEQRSPELLQLVQEYKEKAALMKHHEQFCRLMKRVRSRSTAMNFAQSIFEIIGNYLLNIAFYILMKAKHQDLRDHPVVDRIINWKKVLNKALLQWPNFAENVTAMLDNLEAHGPVSKKWSTSALLAVPKIPSENDGVANPPQRKKSPIKKPDHQDEISKRSITYEMKKNKGLTPKRKREQRNPRVKHRNRYRKALKKVSSQKPPVRKELNRYGGEARGINPYIVRSVKFR